MDTQDTMQSAESELIDRLRRFFRDYNEDELAALLEGWPNDKRSLYVEYADLWNFDPDVAEDYINNHARMQDLLSEALATMDKPVDVPLRDVNIRLTDSRGYLDRRKVDDLVADDTGSFVALQAQIGEVTGKKPRVEEAAFECQRCGTLTHIPQPFLSFREPHQCQGCERQGPFKINYNKSKLIDQRKIKIEQPPEQQAGGVPLSMPAYVLHDLIDVGGENGLQDKAGERVTVLAKVHADDREMKGRGQNEPVVDRYLVPESFVFDDDTNDELDVENHRDDVESYASREDAVDLFARNISPGLTVTEEWEMPIQMATAFLFGAPRIDAKDGSRYRGDLHMLFVSDPGMYKSEFAEDVAELSQDGHYAEATDMSSSVGLTSAAVKDGFGDGQFTLKPGALPRANGGHLILDEIDKGPNGFLDGIHGALEGAQKLRVNKAGMNATLATRVGFMAVGNPVDGEFDDKADIAEQIDLDPALMSRFDLIATMVDTPDKGHDEEVADGVLSSIDESARIQSGELDAADAETVGTEVDRDTMRAWVQIGREFMPMLTDDAKAALKEFYIDTRQLNDSDTVSTTARTLVAGWRLSAAFARCELSETIEERHAERAISIGQEVVSHNWDGEEFDVNRVTGSLSQKERRKKIQECIQDRGKTPETIADETGVSKSKVKHDIEYWQNQRRCPITETSNGAYRWVA